MEKNRINAVIPGRITLRKQVVGNLFEKQKGLMLLPAVGGGTGFALWCWMQGVKGTSAAKSQKCKGERIPCKESPWDERLSPTSEGK